MVDRGRGRVLVRFPVELHRGAARNAVAADHLARELAPRDGRTGQQRPAADRGCRRSGARRDRPAPRGRADRRRRAALGRIVSAHERDELRRDRHRRHRDGPRAAAGWRLVGGHAAAGRSGRGHRDRRGRARTPARRPALAERAARPGGGLGRPPPCCATASTRASRCCASTTPWSSVAASATSPSTSPRSAPPSRRSGAAGRRSARSSSPTRSARSARYSPRPAGSAGRRAG